MKLNRQWLIAYLLLQIHGASSNHWSRIGSVSPLALARNDGSFPSARSLASLSVTSIGGGGSSGSKFTRLDDPGNATLPRGGEVKREPFVDGTSSISYNYNSTTTDGGIPGTVNKKKLTRKERKLERSHQRYAKKLKNRNHLNLSRKFVHAAFGIFFCTLNHVFPRERFVPGMALLTSATLLMEMLRYRRGFGWMNDALHFVLGSSLRKHEMEGKFTGSFYYFLGVTLSSALFPTSAASLGILQLALADPSASYFGRQTRHIYWSRIENGFFGIGRNKGWLGFLGGGLFCFPANYVILSAAKFGPAGIPGGSLYVAVASLSLGLAGAFADLCVPTPALTMPKKICGIPMPRFHVDDNVVVPVFAAFACTKIFTTLGWPAELSLAKYILF